eukprot:UN21186
MLFWPMNIINERNTLRRIIDLKLVSKCQIITNR